MSEEAPHILVVDDDDRLRELLRRYLSDNGHRVSTAPDAAAARGLLERLEFDLMVLDVMMPGENGMDLARDLNGQNPIPILMLTAMGETEDRIAGLESGVDDYLTKPFEPRELLLRIETILRRITQNRPAGVETAVRFGPFEFDLKANALRKGGAALRLTEGELALLKVFAEQPGAPISREDLVASGAVSGSTRTVDVQITRLRRKIEANPKFPEYLQTIRGKGYILRVGPQ